MDESKTTGRGGGNSGDKIVEMQTFKIPKDWKTITIEIPQTTSSKDYIADLTRVIAAGEAEDDHPMNLATIELFKGIRSQLMAAQEMSNTLDRLRFFINSRGIIGHRIIDYTKEIDMAVAAWKGVGGQ